METSDLKKKKKIIQFSKWCKFIHSDWSTWLLFSDIIYQKTVYFNNALIKRSRDLHSQQIVLLANDGAPDKSTIVEWFMEWECNLLERPARIFPAFLPIQQAWRVRKNPITKTPCKTDVRGLPGKSWWNCTPHRD